MSQIYQLAIYGVLVLSCSCTTVAKKTIHATGAVATTTLQVGAGVTKKAVSTSIDVTGSTFHKGVVTVIDSNSGVSHKIPWEKGLSAAAAGKLSIIETAGKAIEIVRDAKRIPATTETVLKPDDTVQIK